MWIITFFKKIIQPENKEISEMECNRLHLIHNFIFLVVWITLKWQIMCLLKSCDGVLLAVANTEVTLLHCVYFSFKKIIINVTEKKNWAFLWEKNIMEKTLSKYIKTYDYRIKDWLHVITYYLKNTTFIRLLSFRRSWSSGQSDFTDKMF